jgi:hypothetical protein
MPPGKEIEQTIKLPRLVSEKASRYHKLVVNIQNLVDESYVLSDDKYAKKLMLKEKEFCKRLDKIIKDYEKGKKNE